MTEGKKRRILKHKIFSVFWWLNKKQLDCNVTRGRNQKNYLNNHRLAKHVILFKFMLIYKAVVNLFLHSVHLYGVEIYGLY